MTCCPNCGHKWTEAKPKRKAKSKGPYLWTAVEFVDGIVVLRGAYSEVGDYSHAIESAQRMRVAATRNGDFTNLNLKLAPKVLRAWHVDGPEKEKVRNKAFAQREVDPAWGKILSRPESSWYAQRVARGLYG